MSGVHGSASFQKHSPPRRSVTVRNVGKYQLSNFRLNSRGKYLGSEGNNCPGGKLSGGTVRGGMSEGGNAQEKFLDLIEPHSCVHHEGQCDMQHWTPAACSFYSFSSILVRVSFYHLRYFKLVLYNMGFNLGVIPFFVHQKRVTSRTIIISTWDQTTPHAVTVTRSHGSVTSVVRATLQVNGTGQNYPSHHTQSPESTATKYCIRDYVYHIISYIIL